MTRLLGLPHLATLLIKRARRLYSGQEMDVELQQSVYALDSTTIDLCLNLFPWARFRSTKAAIKLHTLLDLRGPRSGRHGEPSWFDFPARDFPKCVNGFAAR